MAFTIGQTDGQESAQSGLQLPQQASVAGVWFGPVQGKISPNPELDFGSGSPIFVNLEPGPH